MFSYRHGFRAGSHLDVFKHVVLVELIKYMQYKEAPFMCVDTHAGAGWYSLNTGFAEKSGEYKSGIAKLWDRKDFPTAVADYMKVIRAFNPSGKLRYYPGSPYIAETLLRLEDRLRLYELHSSEIKILRENMHKCEAHRAAQGQIARGKRIMVEASDGFDALKSLLPPQQRRALVLMDPSYEDKRDYQRVKQTLAEALKRFASGTYAVWYPILRRQEARELPKKLSQLPMDSWLNVTFSISKPAPDGFGLSGSGMFIINPPWVLEGILNEVLPYLVQVLGNDSGAGYMVETAAS